MVRGGFGPILERFRVWAEAEPAVRGAIVVGSQARTVAPADEWSDLDLVIFHDSPESLVDSPEWVHRFGPVVLTTVEETALLHMRERRVLYSDGQDVDFSVFPAAALTLVAESGEGLSVLARGVEVVVDKDGHLASIPSAVRAASAVPAPLPDEAEFQAVVADFWYHVLWSAKKLRRGELWTAKMAMDGYLKRLLLRLIEWQAIVRRGSSVDVWHSGRFLEAWAERDTLARLPATFARYDAADLARALNEQSRLFSDLVHEVARARSWDALDAAESRVRELTGALLKGTDRSG